MHLHKFACIDRIVRMRQQLHASLYSVELVSKLYENKLYVDIYRCDSQQCAVCTIDFSYVFYLDAASHRSRNTHLNVKSIRKRERKKKSMTRSPNQIETKSEKKNQPHHSSSRRIGHFECFTKSKFTKYDDKYVRLQNKKKE